MAKGKTHPNSTAGKYDRRGRTHTPLFSLRCSECHTILLSLWKPIGGRWQASEVRGCEHVKREDVITWRYAKRELRDQLGLSVYAPSGGRGPRPERVERPAPPAPQAAEQRRGTRTASVSPELMHRLSQSRPLEHARPGRDPEDD